ncbi:hypothetical protein MLD52_20575 [Puniceicoccaceae bacterium K14]|nr:hypothetical protein [Puniceicoccaceae bacterium K14]
MPRQIGWIERDEELGKLKIEVRFFGDQITFVRQAGRFEPFNEFKPTKEHWDKLEELGKNKFQRGKLTGRYMKLIEARGIKR